MTCLIEARRLSPRAKLPNREHASDAAIRFYAVDDCELLSNVPTVVRTGVALHLPCGWCVVLKDSGKLALLGVTIVSSMIESGRQDEEVVVILNNSNRFGHTVEAGSLVGLGVLLPVYDCLITDVDTIGKICDVRTSDA